MAPNVRLTAAQFRGALDGLLEGVQILDRDLRYEYVNPSAAAQGRQRVVDVVGRRVTEVFPGSETSEYVRALREVLRDGTARALRTDFTLPDGSIGHYAVHIEPVDDGLFVLSIEETEQRTAERALEDTLARYRALLDGLPDWVFLLDGNGTVLDLHIPPSWPARATAKEVLGRSLVERLPPTLVARFREAFATAAASGQTQVLQYEVPLADGLHHFETMVVPSRGDRFTVVARDVTERVELESRLRHAQKLEAVGQMTSGISHDFNNVLQIITANAEVLAIAAEARGEPLAPELTDLLGAARRGADMVAQLMQFSRRTPLQRELVEPGAVLVRLERMLRRILPASVELVLESVPAGVTLSLDRGALEQVVTNLCTNARDAMPTGGRILVRNEVLTADARMLATFPWLAPGRYFCLHVRDTGVGMTAESLRRVFEPFYTTKDVGVGTGLGMAMVYGLMKAHGGAVDVDSALGEGTEVRLLFPVVDAPVVVDPLSLSPGSRAVPGGGETILLVEDDLAIRTVMRRVLELKGYRVLEAQDGAAGLAVFRTHGPGIQLVISDLEMPNLGGRQMADAIRTERPTMPLLFSSGYSTQALDAATPSDDGVYFLPKPWALSDLLTLVRRAIDGSTAPR